MSNHACCIIVKNCYGCEIGVYEVDEKKPIASELTRVIREDQMVLEEGDTITFETRFF